MFLSQYLRIVWARKVLVLGLFVFVAAAGVAFTLLLPRQYTAETSLIVEMRIDPALGALAPALAAPSYMATQIEVLRSERVASRAVKILGVERSTTAVAQWREATKAKIRNFFYNYAKTDAREKEIVMKISKLSGFKESNDQQLLPIRQLDLFAQRNKVEADTVLSEGDKKTRLADIDKKLSAFN